MATYRIWNRGSLLYRSSVTLVKEKSKVTFKHWTAIGFGALFPNIIGRNTSFA
jgi:hypothetical protein